MQSWYRMVKPCLLIVVFGIRISTHSIVPPFGFLTDTNNGETQPVGVSHFSIISWLSNSSIFFS